MMTIHAINIIHIYFTWQEDCALKLHPDPALNLKPRQVGVRNVTSILMFVRIFSLLRCFRCSGSGDQRCHRI